MKDFPETLAEFFLSENGGQSGKQILEAAGLQEQIGDHLAAGLGGLEDAVLEALRCALDLPSRNLILKAWGGLEELQEFTDPGSRGAAEEIVKPLAKHSIRSAHSPRLEVMLDDSPISEIVFDVVLRADLEGFVLRIKDGHIVEITTGSITASGSLALAGQTLLELAPEPFALPGRLRLDPPFQISAWPQSGPTD
jgi:hypothetical protein